MSARVDNDLLVSYRPKSGPGYWPGPEIISQQAKGRVIKKNKHRSLVEFEINSEWRADRPARMVRTQVNYSNKNLYLADGRTLADL